MQPSDLFQGNEHREFTWRKGPGAALFVHGFPGTPAELRPLAGVLHQAGWTVQGLLLPGFGPQIDTLAERHYSEWVAAVENALAALKREYRPVLLIGYSLGAALALQAAAVQPPTALILLAPFWKLGTPGQRLIGRMLGLFFRRIRPFKKADFTDPGMRRFVAGLLPQANPDDPALQQTIRELTVPTRLFAEIDLVGKGAYRLAPQVAAPALVIQGSHDEVVQPARTRRLLSRLPNHPLYREVAGGHDLVKPDQPAWFEVERAVLDFARRFAPTGG